MVIEADMRRGGWAMTLRGIAAVVFGLVALWYPRAAVDAFVVFFAIFAFADAILDCILAATLGSAGLSRGWFASAALLSTVAAVAAIAFPRITFLALVYVVAARAIAMGCVEIGAAAAWRELDDPWQLGVAGVLSVILGALLFASPRAGGLALVWTIGVYAIAAGTALSLLGARMVGPRLQPSLEQMQREART
jgi:uncharacterized membrane protein HdeD (DUF308 family)